MFLQPFSQEEEREAGWNTRVEKLQWDWREREREIERGGRSHNQAEI